MSLRLRWVGIAYFSFAFWDAARAANPQWCACVDGTGKGGVETRLIWGIRSGEGIGWMGRGNEMIGRVGERVFTVCIA